MSARPASPGRRVLYGALFGVLVYAGIILWQGADSILAALEDFPLLLLPAALGLSLLNYAIRFLKWERYRKLLGIELDARTSWLIYLSGFAMGITPGKMGEVFKSWLIRRVRGTPIHHSAPIVVAERLTDLFGYLILIALAGIASAQPKHRLVFYAALALCVLGLALVSSERFSVLVGAVLKRTPFLWRYSGKAQASFSSARVLLAPRQLILPTLQSTLSWGCECVAFWLIASALIEGGVPFGFAVFTYALSAVAGAVAIVFPGGLGVTEAVGGKLLKHRYLELLTGTPIATEAAPALVELAGAKASGAMLITRLCTLWFAVLVGLCAMAIFQRSYGRVEFDGSARES